MWLAAVHVHGLAAFFLVLGALVAILAVINQTVWRTSRAGRAYRKDAAVQEFRGGANLEVSNYLARRINGTIGTALLRISRDGIWLGLTTHAIQKDVRSVECSRADVTEVFPSKGLLTRGVGIATEQGRTHYFWTSRPSRVLQAFAAAGYPLGTPKRPKSTLIDQLPLWWRQ